MALTTSSKMELVKLSKLKSAQMMLENTAVAISPLRNICLFWTSNFPIRKVLPIPPSRFFAVRKEKNNFFRSFSTDQDKMAPKSLAEQFADLDDPTPKGAFILVISNSANSACCTSVRIELTFCDRLRPRGLGACWRGK